MLDTTAEVFRSDPERLARVFALAENRGADYRPDELGSILRHQLSTSVEFDLRHLEAGSQRLLHAAAACGEGGGIRTFGDLFRHPQPPVSLLHLTKNFAKSHLNHPDSPLPPEIATVLYYACIVCALLRCDRRITWLTTEELVRGLRQLLDQPWIEPELRTILELGLERLEDSHSPNP
jgi:hypothetical protein